jgi:hypothetical protein
VLGEVNQRRMAITFVVDRFRQRVLTHADGVVTFEDLNRHLDQEELARGLDLPELIDARAATTNLTAEQIQQLVQRAADIARRIPFGPTAIVTTDDVVYGMARMYSMLAENAGVCLAVFRDLDAAEHWLDRTGHN